MTPKKISPERQAERERVGATLKALRLKSGWTVSEFATEHGISYAYLSNIEAGRKPLTHVLLAKFAATLGVPQMAITHPGARGAA